MKNIIVLLLFVCALSTNAQNRQREITDFKEKWALDVSDMKILEINSIAGNLNIIGVDTNELKIKVTGADTYKLTGGITELGFILSKNKKGEYRIQGIVDNNKEFNVTYEIQVPNAVVLKIQSGSRYLDESIWSISKMKSILKLEKIKGNLIVNDVENAITALNNEGNVTIGFNKLIQNAPNSIASSGQITLDLPVQLKMSLKMHIYRDDIQINSNKVLNGEQINLNIGLNIVEKGEYNYNINGGGILFLLYAYNGSINLKFH